MSIWTECEGVNRFKYLELEPWRIVEDQYSSSSRDLVENSDEHYLLERLLDNSKPQTTNSKHYLIFTPFRYPPLEYGSRFGKTYEPSLWYGSLSLQTAFSEVAYYRSKFFDDTTANLGYIEIRMTAFKAYIKTKKGIDLTKAPFKKYQDQISSKASYEQSQLLGTEMREANVEAFIFTSARDKNAGENVAAFTPDVFKAKEDEYISSMQNWRCIADKHVIEFSRDEILQRKKLEFSKAEFEEIE